MFYTVISHTAHKFHENTQKNLLFGGVLQTKLYF